MKTYRYINKDKENCEYRFENDRCIGFFVNDEPYHADKYKNRKLSKQWEANLKVAGFELQDDTPTS